MLLKAILTLSLIALLSGCQTTRQVPNDVQTPVTGSEEANATPDKDTNGVDMAELRKRRYWHYWLRSAK